MYKTFFFKFELQPLLPTSFIVGGSHTSTGGPTNVWDPPAVRDVAKSMTVYLGCMWRCWSRKRDGERKKKSMVKREKNNE